MAKSLRVNLVGMAALLAFMVGGKPPEAGRAGIFFCGQAGPARNRDAFRP
jgi:hypothetical protein